MSDIGERVKKIVVEHLGQSRQGDRERKLHRRSRADSLDTVRLSWPSRKNSAEIPGDAAETILTVGDAIKFPKSAKAGPAVRQVLTISVRT
jgi:acyl carrier protein